MKQLTALLTKVRSLLRDIEGMQSEYMDDPKEGDHWFGPFSEWAEDVEYGGHINWPNLGISCEEVEEALHDYTRGVDPRGPTPPEVVLGQIRHVMLDWMSDLSMGEADRATLNKVYKILADNPPMDGPNPGYSEY